MVVANVAPGAACVRETLSTLGFAQRAKQARAPAYSLSSMSLQESQVCMMRLRHYSGGLWTDEKTRFLMTLLTLCCAKRSLGSHSATTYLHTPWTTCVR